MARSGTTLMRVMLDSHPNIACGPELRVIPALCSYSSQTRRYCGDILQTHYGLSSDALNSVFADLITSFLEPYKNARGKPRIAEKTPANALHFEELFKLFPQSKFIHVIRDGRDVVASLMKMNWKDDRTGEPMAITRQPGAAAIAWKHHINSVDAAKKSGAAILEVRYEQLIEAPEKTLRIVFEFLNEPWSDEALLFFHNETLRDGAEESSAAQVSKPVYKTARGRWKNDLSGAAQNAVKREAGNLLVKLGYAQDHGW